MSTTRVTLEQIPVLYVESDSGPAGAKAAFDRLEETIGSLRRRKFYGAFQPPDGPYRACVALDDGDDPQAALAVWELPGGVYLRRKLADWPQHVKEIGATFVQMAREAEANGNRPDMKRPSIEFYRSERELLLYLPIE